MPVWEIPECLLATFEYEQVLAARETTQEAVEEASDGDFSSMRNYSEGFRICIHSFIYYHDQQIYEPRTMVRLYVRDKLLFLVFRNHSEMPHIMFFFFWFFSFTVESGFEICIPGLSFATHSTKGKSKPNF